MKKIIQVFSVITIILSHISISYSITGTDALQKFRNRMYGIGKMTGIISWTIGSGQTYTASFKYMSPGKIYLKFNNPRGKIVVSNGKKLWVFNPASNICGIQDLTSGHSGGIAGLTNGYLAILTSRGPRGYTLKLKNKKKRYSQITLMLDSSFFLKKAIIKNRDGGTISFSLSNIDTKANVMKSLFDFTVPANAQTVINPLNIR